MQGVLSAFAEHLVLFVILCRNVANSQSQPLSLSSALAETGVGSRPSDHYFRSVCLSVCLFFCAEFFSAVFDPIWIKLGHMLHVRV